MRFIPVAITHHPARTHEIHPIKRNFFTASHSRKKIPAGYVFGEK